MENTISFADYISFVRKLKEIVDNKEEMRDIATKTMERVAINNNYKPIYLW